jgi:ENTS family enterobactin (siderophore) exporter
MLALTGLINFATTSLLVLWPILSKEVFQTGAWGYGLLASAFGAGVLLGSLAAGVIGRVRRPGLYIYGLAVLLGLGLSLGALMNTLSTALGLFGVLGGVIGMINVVFRALIQEMTPGELRGRVFSWVMLLTAGLVPLSMGVTGAAVDTWGPLSLMMVGGLWVVLVSLLSLLIREVRELE